MTYQINAFTTKTWQEVHDDVLRTQRNGQIALGISADPQLGPGSDEEVWATIIANETQPLYVNQRIVGDAQMPDTASINDPPTPVGPDLTRLMKIKGLSPRGAVGSVGFIILACSTTTSISQGTQLTDTNGLRYEVSSSGTYNNGDLVPVDALDTGSATNHAAGDTLVWVTPPPFCNPKQLVATGGLVDGAPEEDNETARARLLDREQNPPGSGNWPQVAGYAEASTPLVQKAFVYPAVNGPSTCHVAVTGYTSLTSKSRAIVSTILNNIVTPYVLGLMPEYTEVVVTTTTDENADISIGLTLPNAPSAGGPGGGWIDASPWPAISGTANTYANVTAVSAGSVTQFTVNAPTPPTDNVSHICMWDLVTGNLYRAKVLSHSGTAGAYVITIDQPFLNLVAQNLITGENGTFIFPDAVNMDTYVSTLLSAMEQMGPGEKTANASVLTRGYRHPTPQSAWPSSLNATQLKAIEDTGTEVLDTSYYFRSATTPTVPASVSNPPVVLIPHRIGLYPI